MKSIHSTTPLQKLFGMAVSVIVNGGLFLLIALSSGSSESEAPSNAEVTTQKIFCRYIGNGRLYQVEVEASGWQEAEENVCGSHLRDVRLSPLLIEGARLIVEKDELPILLAQRESCSCSAEERVPITGYQHC